MKRYLKVFAAAALAPALSLLQAAQSQETAGADAEVSGATAKVLDIRSKVLDIVGLQGGLAAAPRAVQGRVTDLQGALLDLDAKVTEQEIRIELSADVLFDFDSATLRPEAEPALHKAAAVVQGYAAAPVLIEGHTDAKGAEDYNQSLSERRARSVRDWLVTNAGVAAPRIVTHGWGESRPVAPNETAEGADDPEGRQKNRRVEITIKKG